MSGTNIEKVKNKKYQQKNNIPQKEIDPITKIKLTTKIPLLDMIRMFHNQTTRKVNGKELGAIII